VEGVATAKKRPQKHNGAPGEDRVGRRRDGGGAKNSVGIQTKGGGGALHPRTNHARTTTGFTGGDRCQGAQKFSHEWAPSARKRKGRKRQPKKNVKAGEKKARVCDIKVPAGRDANKVISARHKHKCGGRD